MPPAGRLRLQWPSLLAPEEGVVVVGGNGIVSLQVQLAVITVIRCRL